MQRTRILGVDPGSRLTGYGVVDVIGNQIRHVTHGTLRLSNTGGKAVIPLEQRLLLIYQGLSEVIDEHHPHVMSIEKVFFAKNAVSALKLGQARGAAILSAMIHSLGVVEYSPTEVKAMVVGHGQADKTQVARMVQMVVGAQSFETADASDGLALAICHAHSISAALRQGRVPTASTSSHVSTRGRRVSLAEAVGVTAELIESGARSMRAGDPNGKLSKK